MRFYAVECEAPGGGYGPRAKLVYDKSGRYIDRVDHLDLIFDVWLGSELVQHIQCFCVTVPLWNYLLAHGVTGVSIRDMDVTAGFYVNDSHPGRVIPEFKEMVLFRSAQGKRVDRWEIERTSVPTADMFSGLGLPLLVTERGKDMLVNYGNTTMEIEEVLVV